MANLYNSNLYPPIVDTYAPAFIRTEDCKVTFSISAFNKFTDIKCAEIKLRRQNGNKSVLKEGETKKDIEIEREINENKEEVYFIIIKKEWLTSESFELDTFYSLQIRFISSLVDATSEWSTVCLIAGIDKPILNLKGFDYGFSGVQSSNTINELPPTLDIIGTFTFGGQNIQEKTYVTAYQIKIFKDSGELVYDSQLFETNVFSNPNEINHVIPYELDHDELYEMHFYYITNNLYEETKKYKFFVTDYLLDRLNVELETQDYLERGALLINCNFKSGYKGNFIIRRTSNKSDYKIWQDIHTDFISIAEPSTYVFWDYTVESGVKYKYNIQKIDSNKNRGKMLPITEKFSVVSFDNIFIQSNNKILRIKYNEDINSFKYNVAESRNDTIGSKYPFIRKNANIYYREFPISGTITHLMDLYEDSKVPHSFNDSLKKEEGYIPKVDFNTEGLFDSNNDAAIFDVEHLFFNNEEDENEYVHERDFREAVMSFLYDSKLKLFRSETEGNIIIKLMDISFTPERVVGRKVYHFSANAIEMADFNFDNLNKYKLIYKDIDINNQMIDTDSDVVGMISLDVTSNDNLLDLIQSKYNNYYDSFGTRYHLGKIYNLKIEINSNPYGIKDTKGNLEPSSNNIDYYGYILNKDDEQIFINKNGIYELDMEDVNIKNLILAQDANINIYYYGKKEFYEDGAKNIKAKNTSIVLGQVKDTFKIEGIKEDGESVSRSLIDILKTKYDVNYVDYYQSFYSLDYVDIEATEGAFGKIIYSDEDDAKETTFRINNTQRLILDKKENFSIKELYFQGVKLMPVKGTKEPDSFEYKIFSEDEVIDTEHLFNPKLNYLYKIDKEKNKIYSNQVRAYTKASELELPESEIDNFDNSILKGELIIGNEVVNNVNDISKSSDFWDEEGAAAFEKLSINQLNNIDYKIYYNGNWYDASIDDATQIVTVYCDVDASITYLCTIKGAQY